MSEITVPWGFTRGGLSVEGADGEADIRLPDGATRAVTLTGSDWWPSAEDWAFIGAADGVTIGGVEIQIVRQP